jgi:hypothetical protein
LYLQIRVSRVRIPPGSLSFSGRLDNRTEARATLPIQIPSNRVGMGTANRSRWSPASPSMQSCPSKRAGALQNRDPDSTLPQALKARGLETTSSWCPDLSLKARCPPCIHAQFDSLRLPVVLSKEIGAQAQQVVLNHRMGGQQQGQQIGRGRAGFCLMGQQPFASLSCAFCFAGTPLMSAA